jgi:hypothetical protein
MDLHGHIEMFIRHRFKTNRCSVVSSVLPVRLESTATAAQR